MIIRRVQRFKNNSFVDLFRPCLPEEIVGQRTTKRIIINGLNNNNLNHSLLLTGPAGTGKTTAGRIIALGLNCEKTDSPTATPCLNCQSCMEILNDSSMDFMEINVGKEGGKHDISNVVNDLSFSPVRLRYKVLIFDEAHKLTSAARDLLLKPIEDGFSHVYYIFCTNQPSKLVSADKNGGTPFIDRCTTLTFNPITQSEIYSLLDNICVFEGIIYNKDILNKIAYESSGIPRKAVKWLNQVIIEGSWSDEALNDIIGFVDAESKDISSLYKNLNNGDFKGVVKDYDKLKLSVPPENIKITLSFFFLRMLKTHQDPKVGYRASSILTLLSDTDIGAGKVADINLINLFYKITQIINNN